MKTAIIILIIFILICLYVIINLLRKNEKQEDKIIAQEKMILNFREVILFTNKELQKIDERGTFQSDDEIGFFFKKIKDLQEILNSYFK